MTESLRKGSRGRRISDLQIRLRSYCRSKPRLVPDGIFGSKTNHATVQFQKENFLEPDGIVGPKTQAVLDGTSKDPRIVKLKMARVQLAEDAYAHMVGDIVAKAAGILNVTVWSGGHAFHSNDLRKIGEFIKSGRIGVYHVFLHPKSPELDATGKKTLPQAMYSHPNKKKDNPFYNSIVLFPPFRKSINLANRAGFVHEAVHAHNDWVGRKISLRRDEALAYTVQFLYEYRMFRDSKIRRQAWGETVPGPLPQEVVDTIRALVDGDTAAARKSIEGVAKLLTFYPDVMTHYDGLF